MQKKNILQKYKLCLTTFHILVKFFAVTVVVIQNSSFLCSRSHFVRFQVKTAKKIKVQKGLEKDVVGEKDVISVTVQGKVHAVQTEEDKLDDLNLGDVPLPPEVRLHVRTKSGQAVVSVHDLIIFL